jgi:hypothetical protein
MPFSNSLSIPTVLYFAEKTRPRRILDVGVGIGIYGLLLRTSLDIAHERLNREEWQLKIEGLEIFPPYRNPVWDYAYDAVTIGDVRTSEFAADSFDLVVINDVLEHLEHAEAANCLKRLLTWAPTVIATTPASLIPQSDWGGNPHETHRSVLSVADFPRLVSVKRTGMTSCYVCCRDDSLATSLRQEAGNAPVARAEFWPYVKYRLWRKQRTLAGKKPKRPKQ